MPPANAVWFPVTLVPLVLFTLGLGLILGLINVVIRDVATVVVLLTNFLLLLTPVVYPMRESGPLAVVSTYNPLTVLVRVPCDLLIEGRFDEPLVFAVASVLCLGFFLLAWRLFVLTEQRMTERMGTR